MGGYGDYGGGGGSMGGYGMQSMGMGHMGGGAMAGGIAGQGPGGSQEEHGMQGTIISYNTALGYGFIKSAKVPQDIYFKEAGGHWQPGVAVAFNLKMNRDGKPSA